MEEEHTPVAAAPAAAVSTVAPSAGNPAAASFKGIPVPAAKTL